MGSVGAKLDAPVEAVLATAAVRTEKAISVVRIAFVVANYARALVMWRNNHWVDIDLLWSTLPNMAFVLLWSVYALLWLRPSRHLGVFLLLSVVIDASVCFQDLLTNVLRPGPAYEGLVRMPDMGALSLITLAAGFRLSPRVAVVGTALNLVSAIALLEMDQTINEAAAALEHVYHPPIHVLFVLGAGALAVLVATQTRSLVRRGAETAVRAEQAQKNLAVLLREHHDVRSLLASASLGADLVARSSALGAEPSTEVLESLRTSLSEVRGLVDGIKERAYAEMVALEGLSPVALRPVLDEVVRVTRLQFLGRAIDVESTVGARLLVAGGENTLRRVLHNLLVNACEGDGRCAAKRVGVRVERETADRVAITVRDDGPGFAPHVLGAEPGTTASTKVDGSGFGLALVQGLVGASGGRVVRRNRDEGGAEVVVVLLTA